MSPEEEDAADRTFERHAAAELKRGIESTPPAIRERLEQTVARALQETPRSTSIRFLLPAGIAAAFAAFVIAQQLRTPVVTPAITQTADDLVLLLNVDNLDLLEQMEFYRWLDQQPGLLDQALAASSVPAHRS
jgi:hypothetical protein